MSNEQTQANIFRQGQTLIADRDNAIHNLLAEIDKKNKRVLSLVETLQEIQTFFVERGLHQTIVAAKVATAIKEATE